MAYIPDDLTMLIQARRLMIAENQHTRRIKDPKAKVQSAKEAMEEDQALLVME